MAEQRDYASMRCVRAKWIIVKDDATNRLVAATLPECPYHRQETEQNDYTNFNKKLS